MSIQQSAAEQRRDLILRAMVNDCQRVLAPSGFRLTDRGRVYSMSLVGFRRPTETSVSPAQQTVVVIGHDPDACLMRAHLYGHAPQSDLSWQAVYVDSKQVAERSREGVQTVARWVGHRLG